MKECAYPTCTNLTHSKLCSGHRYQQAKGLELRPLRPYRSKTEALERDELGKKRCLKCDEWKPEDEFDKDTRNTDGYRQSCKLCRRLVTITRAFNITKEQYLRLLEIQDGKCAICRRPPKNYSLAVDHDHSCCPDTGRSCGGCVRGLLCSRCNTGIAMFQDDEQSLVEAVQYLRTKRVVGRVPFGE